jgi:uncharacterized UBP type Zn finger protein
MNLADFSDEILATILSSLPVKDLATVVPQLSHRFNNIVKDEYLWQLICNFDCEIFKKNEDMTWKQTLFKNYCKHFLSLDYEAIRKKFKGEEEFATFVDSAKCSDSSCDKNDADLWICMTCFYIGCSRYKNKHALVHAQTEGHAFNCKWDKLEFWCYHCMRFVGEKTRKEEIHRTQLRKIIASSHNEEHTKIILKSEPIIESCKSGSENEVDETDEADEDESD